jgi:hypothetical protein
MADYQRVQNLSTLLPETVGSGISATELTAEMTVAMVGAQVHP